MGIEGAFRWVALTVVLVLVWAVPAFGTPIPQLPDGNLAPRFVGAAATADGLWEPEPPRHPFMAANGRSNIHDDAYMSDTYRQSGPLGNDLQVLSTFERAVCGSVTFDSQDRIVSVCVGITGPTLYLFDPRDLSTLASFPLPARAINSKILNPFQDFGGGGYFYLDNRDRAVIPTTDHHVYVVAETPGPGFRLEHDYDISGALASGDEITSALPDWSGRIWFVSFNGVVGTIDPASGKVQTVDTHEETENSFSVDETGGVFIVTIKAMYRWDAGPSGQPKVTWRQVYPNSGIREPGQVDAGSGTTPTVQGPYVTITDNANPLDIVVYKRAKQVVGDRVVCVQPIFAKDQGSDENSLIGAGNVMIAENNYGYTGPPATELGGLTAPGIERVDINADGGGCHVVWINRTERVPTVVSKLSLASGLLYSYTKDDPSPLDPWYFTALNVRTGRLVYKQLAGEGLDFNNNYAPVTLGPDGSAYVGVIGGLVEIRDAIPPDVPLPQPPRGTVAVGPSRSTLRLRIRHSQRRPAIVASVTAPAGIVRSVVYSLDQHVRALRTRSPFIATVSLAGLRAHTRHRLTALASLSDGTQRRLRVSVRVP